MINIIFTFNPTQPLQDNHLLQLINERFDFVDRIPEMRAVNGAIPIQATVPALAGLQRIKTLLDSLDSRGSIQIIGVWREGVDIDGNAVMEQHPNFTFDLALYKLHLKNIKILDVNGVETGTTRRPTDAEALATPVNKFAGMPDRVLA